MKAEFEVSFCFDFFTVLVVLLIATVVVDEVVVDVDVVNSWQELSLSII